MEPRPRSTAPPSDRNLALALACPAAVLLLACVFYGYVQPQTPVRMARAGAALIETSRWWSLIESLPLPVPERAPVIATSLIAFAVIAFGAYSTALYIAWQRRSGPLSLRVVLGAALAFFVVSAGAMPTHTTDLYHYMTEARMAAVHGANPYYAIADEFPDDAVYRYASRRYTSLPTKQLPTLMLINVQVARLAGEDPATALLAFRFTLLALNAASLILLAAILRAVSPRRLLGGCVLYGWNPVVAVYGQSKPDVAMVFFLLLATLALVTGRSRLALVPFVLSVFVKLISGPLLVVYWLGTARRASWRWTATSAALAVLTALAIHAPFMEDAGLMLRNLGVAGSGHTTIGDLPRALATCALVAVVCCAARWQDGSCERLFRGWAVTALFIALFLTKIPYSWYLMTLIAVVALSMDVRLVVPAVVVSFVGFTIGTWSGTSNAAFPLPDVPVPPRLALYLALPALATAGALLSVALRRRPGSVPATYAAR